MKKLTGMCLIGAGVGMTLIYQKYHCAVMDKMEEVLDKTMNKLEYELDEMM